VLLLAAPAVPAQELGYRGWGPRVGVSENPDQVFGGIHLDLGEFARNVRFQPNAELGKGDDVLLLAINLEAAYLFPVRQSWMPYAGGGLGVNYVNYDSDIGGGNDTDLGLNLLGGVQRVRSNAPDFFFEMKIGLDDSPDFKFTGGWTFGKPTRSSHAGGKSQQKKS
jgi:hypothetical protein